MIQVGWHNNGYNSLIGIYSPLSSGMAQMMFANVSNEVFAFNTFKASAPQAANHGVSTQFPDTVCIPKVCRNALARNPSTARLRVILTGPLTRHRRRAWVCNPRSGYMGMTFGNLRGFGSIMDLGHGSDVDLRFDISLSKFKYTICQRYRCRTY